MGAIYSLEFIKSRDNEQLSYHIGRPEFKSWLVDVTKFLSLTADNRQRLWHVRNDVWTRMKCLNPECHNDAIWTKNKRYGYCSRECSMPTRISNYEQTCLEKYGVTSYSKTKEYLIKSRESYTKNNDMAEVRTKLIESSRKSYNGNGIRKWFKDRMRSKYLELGAELLGYVEDHHIRIRCLHCGGIVNIKGKLVHSRLHYKTIICTNCNPCRSHISSIEIQVARHIELLGFNIIRNDRKILRPKEIDIYIPSLRLGIDVHGDYWHANPIKYKENDIIWRSKASDIWERQIDKETSAKNAEISYYIVWESAWKFNKDEVINAISYFCHELAVV